MDGHPWQTRRGNGAWPHARTSRKCRRRELAIINGETIQQILAGLDSPDRGLTFVNGAQRTRHSFRDLSALTGQLAARWHGLGLRPGDRVVLVVADEAEFVLSLLAALGAGVVAVPIFPPFVLSQREAYLDGLRRVCRAAQAAACLVGGAAQHLIAGAGLPCPTHTFADLAGARPGPVTAPGPHEPALIQFTSGTTGPPKGVVVTHRALVGHARAIARALALDGGRDRGVSWLPLYHDMGLIGKLFTALVTQTSTWYMSPLRFVRDPVGFLRTMTEVRGTVSFAPNFAYGLLARRATPEALAGLDLSAWRVAGCGAEPVRAGTLRRFAAAYAPVGFRREALVPCYGLAEATLAVCLTPPGRDLVTITVDGDRLATARRAVPVPAAAPHAVELVSSGPPLAGTEVRIVAADGRPLPDGDEGEIALRSDHLASGYYREPAATARTWPDGWLRTGDTGFVRDGELYVTGRIKDLIIINGRNYQPHDIEQVVEQVPGVRPHTVAAFATRRDDTEAVHVVVEATAYPPPADLRARVGEAVGRRFAIPVDAVTVVRKGTLPKTSSGKVRRRHTAGLLTEGRLAVFEPTRV